MTNKNPLNMHDSHPRDPQYTRMSHYLQNAQSVLPKQKIGEKFGKWFSEQNSIRPNYDGNSFGQSPVTALFVACGQLRHFKEAQELGSLVVHPHWRGRGLGTTLCRHLIRQTIKPLYLECLGDRLAKFYTHLGFIAVPWQELPRSLKIKFGISQVAKMLFGVPVRILKYRNKE